MLKEYTHICHGTCSQQVTIVYDDETHIIKKVQFVRGCNGNTQGVAKLCEGQTLENVRDTLLGIKCGPRPTSCPNELALGISEILEK